MNSYNHYAYGAVVDWLYTKAAGIAYDETAPGYKKSESVLCRTNGLAMWTRLWILSMES